MGLLKWFNKERYKSLGEVLSAIRKELTSLQPVDSPDIVWNKTANGMEAVFKGDKSNGATADNNTVSNNTVSGGGYEYDGYFKIIATNVPDSPEPVLSVSIVDGATYNPNSGSSGLSVCKVNSVRHGVPYYTTQIPYQTETDDFIGYFALKFSPPSPGSGESASGSVEIVDLIGETGGTLPNDSPEACWEPIGRVYIRNGSVKVYQDSFGIPKILWFADCAVTQEVE